MQVLQQQQLLSDRVSEELTLVGGVLADALQLLSEPVCALLLPCWGSQLLLRVELTLVRGPAGRCNAASV